MTQTVVLAGILSGMKVNQGSIPTRKRAGFLFQSFLSALLISSIALPPSSVPIMVSLSNHPEPFDQAHDRLSRRTLRPLQAGNSGGMEENLARQLGYIAGGEEIQVIAIRAESIPKGTVNAIKSVLGKAKTDSKFEKFLVSLGTVFRELDSNRSDHVISRVLRKITTEFVIGFSKEPGENPGSRFLIRYRDENPDPWLVPIEKAARGTSSRLVAYDSDGAMKFAGNGLSMIRSFASFSGGFMTIEAKDKDGRRKRWKFTSYDDLIEPIQEQQLHRENGTEILISVPLLETGETIESMARRIQNRINPDAGLEELPQTVDDWEEFLVRQMAARDDFTPGESSQATAIEGNEPLLSVAGQAIDPASVPIQREIGQLIRYMRELQQMSELGSASSQLGQIIRKPDTDPEIRMEAFGLLERIGWSSYDVYEEFASSLRRWGAPASVVERHDGFRTHFGILLGLRDGDKASAVTDLLGQFAGAGAVSWRPFDRFFLAALQGLQSESEIQLNLATPMVVWIRQLPNNPEKAALLSGFKGAIGNNLTLLPFQRLKTMIRQIEISESAGQEEAVSLQKWVEQERNISAVQLVDKASGVVKPYQFLEMRRTTVALPDTDEWWAEATARGLSLLLGMKRLPNDRGNRDFGVFISLVMKEQAVTEQQTVIREQRVVQEQRVKKEQTLFIYQISDLPKTEPKPKLIGQISRGGKITVGRSADEEKGRIVEEPGQGGTSVISSNQHLDIEWTTNGILVTDRSKNGTWLNADLAQKLFPDISFAAKKVNTDRPLVNLADWVPSATVLEWLVSRKASVPMLQIIDEQIRLPGDRGWWKFSETTQGVRVLPGILRVQENVFPQKAGPVLILRRSEEKDRIQVHQVRPNADPQNREPVIGSVGPGETLVFGLAPPDTQNGEGTIVLPDGVDWVVSREHFSIRWEIDQFGQPQGIILGDEGSDNGTFLFKREIAEIAEAVSREAVVPPVNVRAVSLVEAVLAGPPGNLKAVVPLPDGLEARLNSLPLLTGNNALESGDFVRLANGDTVVTREGKRYSLAVLRRESAVFEKFSEPEVGVGIISPDAAAVIRDQYGRDPISPQIVDKRTLYVQEGIFSEGSLQKLRSRYDVEVIKEGDMGPLGAGRIITAITAIPKNEVEMKPVLVTTTPSRLGGFIRDYLGQQPHEGWDLPLTMVSIPTNVIDSVPENNIVEYLLNLIGHDGLPGLTDDTIHASFEQESGRTRMLIEHA